MGRRRSSARARRAPASARAAAGALGIAAAALAALRLGARLRRRYFRVEVAGESMQPALAPRDFLLVRRGPPARPARAFGQVVGVRDPDGRLLLKRVVGLPGESLRVGTNVQVNGRVLVEPYAHGLTPTHQRRGLNRLHDHELFLLGDRRDRSTDSRDFGPVPLARVECVAVLRYWPPRRAGLLRPPARRLVGPPAAREPLPEGIVGATRALRCPPDPRRDHEGVPGEP